MIQIGNSYFDRDSVIAVLPQPDGETVSVCVKWGRIFRVKIEPGERLDGILDRYGMLEPPADLPPDPAGLLTDAEVVELSCAQVEGYAYVAKDQDGRVYAFKVMPEKRGAYWETPVGYSIDPHRLLGDYACLSFEDKEPVEIAQLLGVEDAE